MAEEICHLRELKQNVLAESDKCERKRERIVDMTDFLNEQSYELEENDEQLVRKLIERIRVFYLIKD